MPLPSNEIQTDSDSADQLDPSLENLRQQPSNNIGYDWTWFWRGVAMVFSIPALVLISTFVGYGSIAREAGWGIGHTAFSVPFIWALPSNLLLVAGVASGASLLTIMIAVVFASLRMLPMTMALIPQIRAPHTKKWHLLIACSFVAVTAWVHTLQRAPDIPRNGRYPYFMGFVVVLLIGSTASSVLVHVVAAKLPALLLAALYFLTPLYFATMIWQTTKGRGEVVAMALGLTLSPLFALWFPQSNILLAGLIGGGIGFAYFKYDQSRKMSASHSAGDDA